MHLPKPNNFSKKFLFDITSDPDNPLFKLAKELTSRSFLGFDSNRFGRLAALSSLYLEHLPLLIAFFDQIIDENQNKLFLACFSYLTSEWFKLCCQVVSEMNKILVQPLMLALGVDKYKKKVSLTKFDLNIGVEAINKKLYVFLDKLQGPGGLPYGIEGQTFAVVKDKQDLLAALLMMKRGCGVIFLTTHEKLVKETCYNYGVLPKILKHEKINTKTVEDFASQNYFDSFITGKSIKTKLIEFNPLVGMSEKQIKEKIKLMIENV